MYHTYLDVGSIAHSAALRLTDELDGSHVVAVVEVTNTAPVLQLLWVRGNQTLRFVLADDEALPDVLLESVLLGA